MLGPWQKDAVEQLLLAATDLDGREVLDFALADLLRVVLHVQPGEARAREALRQRLEGRPVLAAHVAPFGAQAGHAQLGSRFGGRHDGY